MVGAPFSVEPFRLDATFLASYKIRRPQFGFGALGELVYLRTYSRLKEDGTNEQWWETIKRVVEGTYSMQKRWILANRLWWSDSKAQRSAQEMYERMFTMKFLPPGRGLWAMGSPLTEERSLYAALNNCFGGDTAFLTAEGVRTFRETVGSTVQVLNREGVFVPAQVNSFGAQSVQKISFRPTGLRSNHRLTITATPNHTWVLRGGTRTTKLRVGDVVQGNTAIVDKANPDYTAGLQHGVIFGDGTQHTYYGDRFMIRLCDVKTQALQSTLEAHERYVSTTVVGNDPFVTIRSNVNLKALPQRGTSPSYIAGFIEGWAAADSYTKPGGTRSIDTQNAEAVEWLVQHAPFAGYIVTGHATDNRPTNYGARSAPLHRLSVTDETACFTVDSIEACGIEEVFCATEPSTATFTLAGGLLTGNCAFVSTQNLAEDKAEPFTFLMDASMLGIGVGFDTKGADTLRVRQPSTQLFDFVIPDSREGWIESLRLLLLAYFDGIRTPVFDYSKIRPEGAPIKGFGGVAAGPEPLRKMHNRIRKILDARAGTSFPYLSSTDIVDIQNLIGKCVVAGNVRRSAEIAFGDPNDLDFLALKNPEAFPERNDMADGWSWSSNNSIFADIGMDYTRVAEHTKLNGEPGYAWLRNMRTFGRMGDDANDLDWRVMGGNPCLEQSLESYELCCLVETFPARHDSLQDYLRTLKFAYLYAKTVTLGNTPWSRTNQVLLRNRRIGLSQSGIVQAVHTLGIEEYRHWCEEGYQTVQHYDGIYSEWLAIPRSIKTTSVKPSGTVSLLAGATPGMHYPEDRFYIRRMRLGKNSELVLRLVNAGYVVESCHGDESSVVVELPVRIEEPLRTTREVTLWEQLALAAFLQRHWADNQVSCTVTFNPEREGDQIVHALNYYQYQLKGVSFLPQLAAGAYPQMPYESITEERFNAIAGRVQAIDFSQTHEEAEQERFCDGATCTI